MATELGSLPIFSDANLVAYYKLENVSDSKASYTLTNNNSVAFNAAKFNNGADFGTSNTNKSLTITNNLGIAGSGAISISFWIRARAEIGSGDWTFISHRSTTTADRYFQIYYSYNGGTRRFVVDSSAGTPIIYNITMGTTDFYHVVIIREAGGTTRLYVNGTAHGTSTAGTTTGGGNGFSIGDYITGVNYSSVIIDDCAVFNDVLTPTEITAIYEGLKPSFMIMF